MMLLLSIGCVTFYVFGAILSIIITGWDLNKVSDLLKILTWPISLFLKR